MTTVTGRVVSNFGTINSHTIEGTVQADGTYQMYGITGSNVQGLFYEKPTAGWPAPQMSFIGTVSNKDVFLDNSGGKFNFFATDGSAAGTQEVFSYNTKGASSAAIMLDQYTNRDLISVNSGGFYTIAATNGTAAGTQVVATIYNAPYANTSVNVTGHAGGKTQFDFVANGHATLFYSTDGTAHGTAVSPSPIK